MFELRSVDFKIAVGFFMLHSIHLWRQWVGYDFDVNGCIIPIEISAQNVRLNSHRIFSFSNYFTYHVIQRIKNGCPWTSQIRGPRGVPWLHSCTRLRLVQDLGSRRTPTSLWSLQCIFTPLKMLIILFILLTKEFWKYKTGKPVWAAQLLLILNRIYIIPNLGLGKLTFLQKIILNSRPKKQHYAPGNYLLINCV